MYTVRPYASADEELYRAHFERSVDESGRGEPHFNPFIPGDEERPRGASLEVLEKSLAETGWMRLWIAQHEDGEIVGHVNLKGGSMKTMLHRASLGIGIERPHRGKGLGQRLMQAAIEFARDEPMLDYIDLTYFEHNEPARALYDSCGFVEQGRVTDKFRIGNDTITDVIMALDLRGS